MVKKYIEIWKDYTKTLSASKLSAVKLIIAPFGYNPPTCLAFLKSTKEKNQTLKSNLKIRMDFSSRKKDIITAS